MRVPAILLLAALLPATAPAAQLVTVDQIQQILTAHHGDSDAKLAEQVSSFEAAQRIDTPTLLRWQAAAPGDRTREALLLLAYSSAFLPLPPSRIVDQPPPDSAALQQILGRTIAWLGGILHNLPNFLAVRNITQFADSPMNEKMDVSRVPDAQLNTQSLASTHLVVGEPWYVPLYRDAHKRMQVSYRDGREIQVDLTKNDLDAGLRSRGEFGAILAVVIGDAFRQKLEWDHWEQSPVGPLATFRYSVPADASHYVVEYPNNGGIKRFVPAYHGEFAIDPATGTVYRIALIAHMPAPYDRIQSALVVEYGSVVLGNRTYICPLRSVNLARVPLAGEAGTVAPELRTFLNDVAFTNYQLFRADARIVGSPSSVEDQPPQPH
jgi:hypothetical protein